MTDGRLEMSEADTTDKTGRTPESAERDGVSPLVYFSHSYRTEDRALNLFIWILFSERNFHFTVDPQDAKPRPMDVTFLERMMQRSACFVAAVPNRFRRDSPTSWSPYQEFEYGLAIRSGKPRLIFAEEDITLSQLLGQDRDSVVYFTKTPEFYRAKHKELGTRVDRFLQQVTITPPGAFLPVGIIRGKSEEPLHSKVIDALYADKQKRGADVELEELIIRDHEMDSHLLSRFENTSVLIVEIRPEFTPHDVLGLIHGRCFPCIRTCRIAPGEDEEALRSALGLCKSETGDADGLVGLPRLYKGFEIDPKMTPVLFWRDEDVGRLAKKIVDIILDLRVREKDLKVVKDATEYFLSLGGKLVFISNAGGMNSLGDPLADAMRDKSINYFHYTKVERASGSIPTGEPCREYLHKEIMQAELFVALVNPAYWKSLECELEFDAAIRRWDRHELQLLIYQSGENEELPPFLQRSQIGQLDQMDHSIETILRDTERVLERGNILRLDPDHVERLASLLQSVWPVTSKADASQLLGTQAGMTNEQLGLLLKDGEEFTYSATSLLKKLIAGATIEAYGVEPLGLLILNMARQVSHEEDRGFLKGLIPRYRLFRNVNNLEVWKSRRRRSEVGMVLDKGGLQRRGLPVRSAMGLEDDFLEMVIQLTGESENWDTVVEKVGQTLAGKLLSEADSVRWFQSIGNRFCIASRESDLTIPIEWLVGEAIHGPLGKRHAVRRYVIDYTSDNALQPLDAALGNGDIPPPRVLLIGYGGRGLREVSTELSSLRDLWKEHYQQLGWPRSLIQMVPAEDATRTRFEQELRSGDYQIIHFCGHADYDENDRPFLQFCPPDDRELDAGRVSGEELGHWASAGQIRFFYLNCCLSAASPASVASRSTTLVHHLLQAGVPEVIAYLWPIKDQQAMSLAVHYYQEYLHVFDAAEALRMARDKKDSTEESIWAAPILVSQDRFPEKPGPDAEED